MLGEMAPRPEGSIPNVEDYDDKTIIKSIRKTRKYVFHKDNTIQGKNKYEERVSLFGMFNSFFLYPIL